MSAAFAGESWRPADLPVPAPAPVEQSMPVPALLIAFTAGLLTGLALAYLLKTSH
jgi:hypothetical protein